MEVKSADFTSMRKCLAIIRHCEKPCKCRFQWAADTAKRRGYRPSEVV